ncbi:MAG TPA: hypothetical protein VJK29_21525 [Terriglobales bacterium]|nr:hypothetical protein [Terriglobales bacterium]
MVTTTLVERDIEDGKRLIKALDESEFKVRSALWFYVSEADKWVLYIASPIFDEKGPSSGYAALQKVLLGISPRLGLSLGDVAVVSPNDDLIKLLRSAVRTGPGISTMRFSRNTINGVFIQDALLYRVQ